MPQLALGTIQNLAATSRLVIEEAILFTHMIVFGGTRSGKSKLFEHICRLLILNGRGLAWIDPHGDTADDLLSFLAYYRERLGLAAGKIHYLNPATHLFCFDPFRYHPDPDESEATSEFHYRCWLNTKIKDMVGIICRQQGESKDEQQKMVRLRRWLYNGLYAIGVRQDADGTHFPLHEIFALLDPRHPRHDALYRTVEPLLEAHVRADFEKLRATKDPRKQEDWVESTFNRLRDIITPLTQEIFRTDRPSIDFHEIVANGGVLLASLGKTRRFHEDEALTIAGLIIREITEAVRTVERDRRKRFYLFMDEAQHFVNDDLLSLLKESGKYKLVCGMAVQSLDNLQRGENVDLVPAVLGQCGFRVSFRQGFFEHAETLAKSLMFPLLDFTPLTHEVDRDDGYDWVLIPSASTGKSIATGRSRSQSHSRSRSVATNWSRTVTLSTSVSTSQSRALGVSAGRTRGASRTVTLGWANSVTAQHTDSSQQSASRADGVSSAAQVSQAATQAEGRNDAAGPPAGPKHQPQRIDGQRGVQRTVACDHAAIGEQLGRLTRDIDVAIGPLARGETNAASLTGSQTLTAGASHVKGKAVGASKGGSVTETTSHGETNTTSESHTATNTESLSLTPTPLRRTRVEQQMAGRLQTTIQDQVAAFTHQLMSLEPQHCVVSLTAFHSSLQLRVADVRDPFAASHASPQWAEEVIQQFRRQAITMHPYCFSYTELMAVHRDQSMPGVDALTSGAQPTSLDDMPRLLRGLQP